MLAFVKRTVAATSAAAFAALAVLLLAGCDQLLQNHTKKAVDQAQEKYAAGDFQGAVQFYEDAIDGTEKTADLHYKLALIYDDKLKNPLGAMHHLRRYLELRPSGSHAKDAQNFIKEDELKLLTTLSRSAFMSQDDAARLKNDNLALRKQLAELRASPRFSTVPGDARQPAPAGGPPAPGSRSYTVGHGDTLASIARKFYKNPARWKDIQDANFTALKGTVKLKPGMTLIIPK
jgi:tetratricopeptide (TPR) repeat protein